MRPTPGSNQAAMELCWLTCVSSELNAEELTRSGGVDTVGALLRRCVDVMQPDVAPTAPPAVIATHALRAFAGMAAFPAARELLAERCAGRHAVRPVWHAE
jgi:hypothetical protein